MSASAMKFVSPQDVESVLDYAELIEALERGLGNFSKVDSGILQPVRTVLNITEQNGFFASMPVYSQKDKVLTTKLLSFYPENKDIPTHNALILAFDTDTGVPKALLDGDVITARRTAAASAVATKHLVNGEPSILAILGSGVQARSHVAALSTLFTFNEIRIWNHRKEGAEKLAKEVGDKAIACCTVGEAVTNADVIVTATSTKTPVLSACCIKPGAHINAVGAPAPTLSEMEPELMLSSVVYVDSYDGARKESGDIINSKAPIFAEIGEVINGSKEAKRTETTIFKSLGMALEDGIATKLVLDRLKI